MQGSYLPTALVKLMPNYASFFADGKNTVSESSFLLLRGMLPQMIPFEAAGNAGKNDDTGKKNHAAGTGTETGNASAAAFLSYLYLRLGLGWVTAAYLDGTSSYADPYFHRTRVE